jgi:hypothetical protein
LASRLAADFLPAARAASRRAGRVSQYSDPRRIGSNFLEQLHLLASDIPHDTADAGDVATGTRETGHHSISNRISNGDHDNRDRAGRPLCGECRRSGRCDENVRLRSDEIGSKAVQSSQPFGCGSSSYFQNEVSFFQVPEFAQSLPQCLDVRGYRRRRERKKYPYAIPARRLLRFGGEWCGEEHRTRASKERATIHY